MTTDKQADTYVQFIKFLLEKGYPKEYIYVSNYRSSKNHSGKWYKRVEIHTKGKVIQAFIVMPDSDRENLAVKRYPFYRSFKQNATKNDYVYPSCYIVTHSEKRNCLDVWNFYGCNCLDYKLDEDIISRVINYKEARRSFFKRWNSVPSISVARWLRIVSLTITAIGLISILFYKWVGLSPDNLCFIGVVVFISAILAAIAPCARSFTIYGAGFHLMEDDER